MICASLNRPFFIVNPLRYLAEKILLLNTTNFRGDYPLIVGDARFQIGTTDFAFTPAQAPHVTRLIGAARTRTADYFAGRRIPGF